MKIAQGLVLTSFFSGMCAAAALAQGAAAGPEPWVEMQSSQVGAGYMAARPILRKESYSVIWHLQSFADPQAAGGKAYRSVKTQMEYNCAAREARSVYAERYAGAMGTGQLVELSYDETDWRAVPAAGGFRLACRTGAVSPVIASAP